MPRARTRPEGRVHERTCERSRALRCPSENESRAGRIRTFNLCLLIIRRSPVIGAAASCSFIRRSGRRELQIKVSSAATRNGDERCVNVERNGARGKMRPEERCRDSRMRARRGRSVVVHARRDVTNTHTHIQRHHGARRCSSGLGRTRSFDIQLIRDRNLDSSESDASRFQTWSRLSLSCLCKLDAPHKQMHIAFPCPPFAARYPSSALECRDR